MARTGRCRCGALLRFRRGPDGYKTRCQKCNAVVRLRTAPRKTAAAQLTNEEYDATRELPQPVDAARQVTSVPQSPAKEHRRISPSGVKPGARSRTSACEVCCTLVPADAIRCPACGAKLPSTTAAPAESIAPNPPLVAPQGQAEPIHLHWKWLVAIALFLMLAFGATAWLVWFVWF